MRIITFITDWWPHHILYFVIGIGYQCITCSFFPAKRLRKEKSERDEHKVFNWSDVNDVYVHKPEKRNKYIYSQRCSTRCSKSDRWRWWYILRFSKEELNRRITDINLKRLCRLYTCGWYGLILNERRKNKERRKEIQVKNEAYNSGKFLDVNWWKKMHSWK